jgi:hypothetical protein
MAAALPVAPARYVVVALTLALLAGGCSDFGDPVRPTESSPSPTGVRFDGLFPARTVIGDSVRVVGRGFGAQAAGASFRFPGAPGTTVAATVLAWSDTQLVVLVPNGATMGATRFERGSTSVPGPSFATAPRRVTYSRDVVPLFDHWGCTQCHGGSGNLNVRPWSALLAGTSDHGPVVIPRDSTGSLLVQRVRPEASYLLRMPQGGPYLDPATVLLLADWVDQGARND